MQNFTALQELCKTIARVPEGLAASNTFMESKHARKEYDV